jgi:succinate dehydrogenase/fumarate reductase flavoprotein subunit
MAVEAGAVLSGMEFSSAYAIAPKGTSLTKTAYYSWATFYRADRTVLEGAANYGGRSVIAKTLLSEPVFARLDRATEDEQISMRKGQPNFFLVFDRLGVNPFSDFFEITLLAEGTVRGTGGVRIAGYDCSTDVPGLYAAGDTATRELICGGFTGGGSHNAAWAASSGSWAGQGAASFATRRGRPAAGLRPVGGAGIRPSGAAKLDYREVVAEVQRHVLPYDINYLRHGDRLRPALKSLHDNWFEIRSGLGAEGEDLFRAREAAAMVAHGRWMYHAALSHPTQDPVQTHRLLTGGLDAVWSRPESARLAA